MDIVTLALIAIPIAILYFWYASIISKRNKAKEGLSGIDVQLKKRSNLIPNVLKIANKFLVHEKSLFNEITELRTGSDKDYDQGDAVAVRQHLAAAEQLTDKMGQLMIAVENYPDLKSDKTMIQAMQTYNEVEAHIAAARRFYNSAVTSLNSSVQIFPGSIIASMVGVSEMPFYKAEEASKSQVDADDYLK